MLSAEGVEPTTPITQGSNKSPEPDTDNYQAAFPTQSATQSQSKANTGLGRPLPPSIQNLQNNQKSVPPTKPAPTNQVMVEDTFGMPSAKFA